MDNFGYKNWMVEEINKCRKSFHYFCKEYVKIIHPIHGLIPFELYSFQDRIVGDYEIYPYNIVNKFRQAGLTTVTVIWCLWRCLFKRGQRIMVISKSDREAIGIGKIVQNAKSNLPDWLQPRMRNDNDREKEFNDTDSVMWFYTVQGVRSRSLTYMIIDEAAFIQNMEEHWKALYPSIATGGRCIAISTVNGIGNWYHTQYTRAQEHKNQFHVIDIDYTEHPDYNNAEWVKRTRANLGEKGWLQEVMRSFLGSGETYIDPATIQKLEAQTSEPKRKLFSEWDSFRQDILEDEEMPSDEYQKGALWIWKEPELNREYIISADASEGVGDDGDNSAFHIIETKTMEQVAEFYSNIIPPHKFAQVLSQTAIFYNNALVIVENDTGPGLSTLNRLEHTLYYENLYYTSTGPREKTGITLNKTTRPVVLETMQTCLVSSLVKINSKRFVDELKTFVFNRQKQRAEAQKGKHDDLVLAIAIALHITDVMSRDLPMGLTEKEMPKDVISEMIRGDTYQQMKVLLEEGLPEDEFGEDLVTEEDLLPNLIIANDLKKRPMDAIIRSFGW